MGKPHLEPSSPAVTDLYLIGLLVKLRISCFSGDYWTLLSPDVSQKYVDLTERITFAKHEVTCCLHAHLFLTSAARMGHRLLPFYSGGDSGSERLPSLASHSCSVQNPGFEPCSGRATVIALSAVTRFTWEAEAPTKGGLLVQPACPILCPW